MTKKLIYLFLFILNAFTMNAQDIPEKPNPPRMVNDFAGILGTGANALEEKLRIYNDTTSTQIVVVTVSSLNGYDAADFSVRLAESWGIGQKGKNNGILIFVAPNERKMLIEVGYGLEAFVPDAKAKWIIDNVMKPAFKQGDYVGGINGAVNEIIDKASGAYSRDGSETDKASKKGTPWGLLIIVLIFVLYSIFKKRSGGGYTGYSSGGTFYGGGGGFGGGSSSGSSFGGFGGGSFGGGGAGGDW